MSKQVLIVTVDCDAVDAEAQVLDRFNLIKADVSIEKLRSVDDELPKHLQEVFCYDRDGMFIESAYYSQGMIVDDPNCSSGMFCKLSDGLPVNAVVAYWTPIVEPVV